MVAVKASVKVRPPRWKYGSVSQLPEFDRAEVKVRQTEFLAKFRRHAAKENWDAIHDDHFDWWQFPIDDGSREQFNLKSEEDIRDLVSDTQFMDQFHESLRIVSLAFGWDIDAKTPVDSARQWVQNRRGNKDVRLAKMIRSAWLLSAQSYFESLQEFAKYINKEIYRGNGFKYGHICLDEILFMSLPRMP